MNIQSQVVRFCIIISLAICGCKSNKPSNLDDEFALYTTTEVFDSIIGSNRMIPTLDHKISIPANQPLEKKINILFDSISKNNFNNLKIETLQIDESPNGYKSLKINLKENPGFIIPDSLGNYHSWYEFFQGSMGGERTTIILRESILQREYIGDWINEVEFYYQNKKMGEWDHISLSGIIKRK